MVKNIIAGNKPKTSSLSLTGLGMDDTAINYGKKERFRKKPNKRESSVCSSTNLHKYKVDGAIMIN